MLRHYQFSVCVKLDPSHTYLKVSCFVIKIKCARHSGIMYYSNHSLHYPVSTYFQI